MRFSLRLSPPASERERFLRFLLTGGLAAAANVGSGIAFATLMSYQAAIIAAFFVGLTTGFLLSRVFVFEARGTSLTGQFLRFTLVNLIALLQIWAISMGLAFVIFPWLRITWHPETIAHAIGVLVPVFTSFLGHRHFSFRESA